MGNVLFSALCMLLLLGIVCVIFFCLFSVSAATLSVLAAIFLLYGALMALSWKYSKKAQKLQDSAVPYNGTKQQILKIAFCIAAPFYFLLLLLALFPIRHYAVWLLFFLPAMIVFSLPLGVVAEFCCMFGIPKRLFWSVQILIQLAVILVGRAGALLLFNRFY